MGSTARDLSGLKETGARRIADDIVLPRSKLPVFVREVRALSKDFGLRVACFGHAGDGNLHVNILFDEEEERAETLREKILALVLSLSGTISGEHGIGLTKRAYLPWEIPPQALSLMSEIKQVFDPKGLLNPGKIF